MAEGCLIIETVNTFDKKKARRKNRAHRHIPIARGRRNIGKSMYCAYDAHWRHQMNSTHYSRTHRRPANPAQNEGLVLNLGQ